MLTMFEDDEAMFAAMRAGARGYLLKGADQRRDHPRAIGPSRRARPSSGLAVARRLIALPQPDGGLTRGVPRADARGTRGPRPDRGRETNAAIARRLGIADKTVRNHVSNILTKLQVERRAEAIVRARRAGLGTSGPDDRGSPPSRVNGTSTP